MTNAVQGNSNLGRTGHEVCGWLTDAGRGIGDRWQEIIHAEAAMPEIEFPKCERKWVILSAVALPALGAISYWLSHNYLSTPQ